MRSSGKLLYFLCFAALAVVAALSLARVGRPSIAGLLVWSALAAAVAGAPGLVHRRAWPVALVLLPAGAYLVVWAQVPIPAGDHGFGGQFGVYLRQLHAATQAYSAHTFPFDLAGSPGLKLLLSCVIYGVTGLASFVALSLRKALPAVAIFLALLGFSLTVDGADRVVLLPLAFLLLAGCLLTLSRSLERRRWASAGVTAGVATALTASLVALFLLAATPVAASKPWQDWSTWGPIGQSSSRLAFNWMLNFPNLLDPKTDAKVIRVESPVASYWRANALDYFNGDAWLSGSSFESLLTAESPSGGGTFGVPANGPVPPGKTVTEVYKIQSLYTDFLFAGGTPTALVFDRHVGVYANGALALRLARPQGPQLTYGITAVVPQLKATDLVARGRDYPLAVLPDTMLPFPAASQMTGPSAQEQWHSTMNGSPADREWLGLYQLNSRIVREATDPYQITLRIEQYLRTNYSYSLSPPPTRYDSPYAAFLFDTKTGYCQHFAGAMAILLRYNGIPARVAVGFTTGQLVGRDTFVVSRTDAHAWVEVYFPGVGWVPFDPTPGRTMPGAGPSSSNAGFVNPFPQDAGPGSVAAAGSAPGKLPGTPGNAAGRRSSGGVGTSAASRTTPDWLPWAIGLAAVLLVWPFARAVLRRRGLRRGGPDGRLRAWLKLVYSDLRDYGLSVPPSQTLEETSRYLKESLDLDAAPLTTRLEAVLFGGRAADEHDVADIARLRLELRRRLRARHGWLSAVRARYGLRLATR
jgi:protein-glutamine gamma-glutamyltransferase